MNRNQHYHRDKKLLALDRERKALWKRMRQFVKIDPPITRGWIRHWRLTPKARNRHDASILQYILREIDNPRFHWRKNFVSGRRRQRKKMLENDQLPQSVSEYRWKRLGWPAAWKKYFHQILKNPGQCDQTFKYKFQREDLFELFTERHYVRRVRVLDVEAESRLAELDMHLTNRQWDHRLKKLLDTGYRWGSDSVYRKQEHQEKRRIRKAMEGDWEAEVRRRLNSLFTSAAQLIKTLDSRAYTTIQFLYP